MLQTRDSRRGLVTVAANLTARQLGVRPGMSISEATALAALEIRPHDAHEDLDQLCNLTEQAQQFSPIVGLEQLDKKLWAGRNLLQPECLLLDVTGLASHFGGEERLLQQIAEWLYDQRYFACMAIAGTVGTAWAVANYSCRKPTAENCPPPTQLTSPSPESRSVITGNCAGEDATTNKLPKRIDQPTLRSRFVIVSSGGEATAIERLPIAGLRLTADTVQTLQRLGIQCVGQLDQLPRAGLATRLGQTLLDRWDQALGNKAEGIIALHMLPEWHLEQSLEYPTEHHATIAELVRRLSQQLTQRLANRGQGAMRLLCRLDLVDSTPLIMQLGLFRPTADAEHLQSLLIGQLEQQLRRPLPAAVWRLSIQATLTAPLVWHQTDLFEGDAVENRHQLARLVDNLSSRLGRRHVLSAYLERESQPEQACTLKPMTGRRTDGQEQATLKKLSSRLARHRAEPSTEDPLRRPTRLLSPPAEIEVLALASEGLPAKFKYHQQAYNIIQHWGPERLESGWWRGPSVRRDYFRVETEHGAWWWIFRDMHSNRWFLHGIFD